MIHPEGWSAGDEPLAIELNCFGCNKPFDTYDADETFCPDCVANQKSIDAHVELWAKEESA